MQLRALTPIRHDGRDYAAGELLEVGERDAVALVSWGAAAAVPAGQPEARPETPAAEPTVKTKRRGPP